MNQRTYLLIAALLSPCFLATHSIESGSKCSTNRSANIFVTIPLGPTASKTQRKHVSCGFARVFVGQLGHWFDARVSRIDKGRLAIFAEADRMQMAQVTQH